MRVRTASTCGRLVALCLAALLVSSCATGPVQSPKSTEEATLQKIAAMEGKGDFQGVARQYNKLAARLGPPQRQEYRLKAAAALVKGNYIRQAKRILDGLTDRELTVNQFIRRQLLLAHIAQADHAPDRVLKLLDIRLPADTPAELQAQFHRLRADAQSAGGKPLEAIRELIAREQYLPDHGAVVENQQLIWRTLLQLPEQTLSASPAAASKTLKGWLALAAIVKRAQQQPVQINQLITNWQTRYPDHPVTQEILAPLLATLPRIARPTQIALLLPLSGSYAGPARALRNGFLLARYAHGDADHQPDIRIYDVGEQPDDIVTTYKKAVDEGAEFVVGPLSKEAVQQLMTGDTATVPTLALNYGQQDKPTPGFYQFGLSPEDEARQVAERAWLDGHNQAIAIIPDGDWGQRVLDAFERHWSGLGGLTVEAQSYNPRSSDFSAALRTLLNLDRSRARRDALAKILGQSLEFKPRRRRDADFVFMAAFPQQARLIRPQLEFHYAGDLPVYATSHTYSGTPDQRADHDLDGVMFCDMPWILSDDPKTARLKATVRRLWPEQAQQFIRFYALGYDAYNIIPQLDQLKRFPYDEYNGETGVLTVDQDNKVHRRLLWARFVNGAPKLTDAIMPVQH